MSRQMGGVTQVKFSPDGVYLYSASRQDPLIRCWDIRNTAQVLATVERPGETTNQRIRFDLSSNGRWLVTGDMNGDLSIFDLLNMSESTTSDGLVTRVHCHEDIVSAAVFHPNDSRLATSSGQRKYDLGPLLFDSDFGEPDKLSELEDSIVDDLGPKAAKQAGTDLVQEQEATSLTVTLENSIRIWSLPGQYVWYVNDDQQWKQTTGSVPE
ncbi:Telomerase Cajal body protein 1 [Lunasporangiospora selenospora]|uniref:Telomerase Cajal body protein 1 n=1 Tax=Lunasporangiospora selenospora TaxID=979761 RepID=A0A9P6G252_9FUNG|nr:Telomerase Cajal body protein 1 [Lunasporangiospora selenospora]